MGSLCCVHSETDADDSHHLSIFSDCDKKKKKSLVYCTLAVKTIAWKGHTTFAHILLARISHMVISNFARGGKYRKVISVILHYTCQENWNCYPMLMSYLNKSMSSHFSQGSSTNSSLCSDFLVFEALKYCFLFHFLITGGKVTKYILYLCFYSILTGCSLSPPLTTHTYLLFSLNVFLWGDHVSGQRHFILVQWTLFCAPTR